MDEGGDEYYSERVIGHEDYNSRLIRHDIGLIRVDKDIVFSDSVQPINLPTQSNLHESNYYAVLSGWGTTSVRIYLFIIFNNKQTFYQSK